MVLYEKPGDGQWAIDSYTNALREGLDRMLGFGSVSNIKIASSYNPIAASIISGKLETIMRTDDRTRAMHDILSYKKFILLANRDVTEYYHYIPPSIEESHPMQKVVRHLDNNIIRMIGEYHGFESLRSLDNEDPKKYECRMLSSLYNGQYDLINTVLSPLQYFPYRNHSIPRDYSIMIVDSLYNAHRNGDNGALLFLHGHLFGHDPNSPMRIGNPSRMLKRMTLNNKKYDIGSGPLIYYPDISTTLIEGQYEANGK
ncbi:MAG: hypothetical protein ACMXYL_01060 [Candidatus Woesearchaeota archaeon]